MRSAQCRICSAWVTYPPPTPEPEDFGQFRQMYEIPNEGTPHVCHTWGVELAKQWADYTVTWVWTLTESPAPAFLSRYFVTKVSHDPVLSLHLHRAIVEVRDSPLRVETRAGALIIRGLEQPHTLAELERAHEGMKMLNPTLLRGRRRGPKRLWTSPAQFKLKLNEALTGLRRIDARYKTAPIPLGKVARILSVDPKTVRDYAGRYGLDLDALLRPPDAETSPILLN